MAPALADRWIAAANFTPGRIRTVRLLVVHTTEGLEVQGSAVGTAKYFAGQPRNNQGSSAHFCIDDDAIVQCVALADTAWAAPGCNADGIQLEHSGTAGQSAAQWDDPYSDRVLARSAGLARALCQQYRIPIRHLTDDQLRAGAAGIVGHDQVSRVYRRSDHTDPGPNFPWDRYLTLISTGQPQEAPMTTVDLTPDALNAVSAEVWGPSSSYVRRLPADLASDPAAAAKYAEGHLPDGSPTISPITTLGWAMDAARAALAAVGEVQRDVTALRQDVAALRQDVARLAAASGADPQALAAAVADLLALRLKS